MKKVNLVTFSLLLVYSCSQPNKNVNKKMEPIVIEYHILPQTIKFIPAASGDIYQYCEMNSEVETGTLLKSSKFIKYNERGFNCKMKKDPLCTYFYGKNRSLERIRSYVNVIRNLKLVDRKVRNSSYSRAVICSYSNSGAIDSIIVNQDKSIIYKGWTYSLVDSLLYDLLSVSPKEIQENWKYELGDITTVQLDLIRPRSR